MTNGPEALIDGFGRRHDNLRISVTDRCNIRCTYCMPESVQFLPRADLLSFEEIARIVRVGAALGITKLRLTGGEPLVRRDLPRLIALLVDVPGICDIGLTTNGVLLGPLARPLREAGLRRLNVSLDTLRPETFRTLTRRDGLDQVVAGIHEARAAGFAPIKLNTVVIRGTNDDEVVDLARFAREHGLELRFIEYMPLDDGQWERAKVLPARDLLGRLAEAFGPLRRTDGGDPHAPATDYAFEEGGGRIGIIASVSQPFCGACNRVRLTADGKLRNCLFALDEVDLRGTIREGGDDEAIAAVLRRNVASKWEGHQINSSQFVQPGRLMHAIGG